MGKKPLNENQVKSLRKLVKDKPLHELLLNISVDLMLRSSDLLSLRVKDVMNESGSVKTEVKVFCFRWNWKNLLHELVTFRLCNYAAILILFFLDLFSLASSSFLSLC